MYKVHQIRESLRNNLPPLNATVSSAWQSIKSAMPDSCLAQEGENLNFAKVAQNKENYEMGTFQNDLEGKQNGRTGSIDSQSDDGCMGEHGMSKHKISEWEAGWNVTNAIQGMFVVSLPYAVLHGGYWAIIAMAGIAYICYYTGQILVDCLYEVTSEGEVVRVRDSYNAIADVCWGEKYGGKIVNCAQLIELLMTCILYIVLCGDLMIGTFPEGAIDQRSWMMLLGIVLIPCGFLKDLRHVSTLSFWCTMAHVAINVIILGYCLGNIGSWGWSKVSLRLDIFTFPIALGVIVFSYTSQIFLPTLEGNMKEPKRFTCMLKYSHIAAAIFKSLFGYLGFLTWQDDTEEVITNNLPTQGFKALVNFFLISKALLSFPLPYYAAIDLLERALFQGRPTTLFPSMWDQNHDLKTWGIAFRVLIVTFTVMMAVAIPHFSILMGFIGSFTGTMLSFIWPCYFHLKLKGNTLPWGTVAYDCFVIFLGVMFGVVGMYYSGRALNEAFKIGLPL